MTTRVKSPSQLIHSSSAQRVHLATLAGVDHDSVARIRRASFSPALRGYDKQEVDNFLGELADWLENGGEDESRADVVHNELELIGEETGAILTAAHEAAETMRNDADRDARKRLIDANLRVEAIEADVDDQLRAARDEADAYTRKTRADADAYDAAIRKESDDYSSKVRADADAEAKAIVARANAEARELIEAAVRKRKDIESVISDLEQRHSTVVSELESLASGIAGAATQHRAPATAEPVQADEEATGANGGDDSTEPDPNSSQALPLPQRQD